MCEQKRRKLFGINVTEILVENWDHTANILWTCKVSRLIDALRRRIFFEFGIAIEDSSMRI